MAKKKSKKDDVNTETVETLVESAENSNSDAATEAPPSDSIEAVLRTELEHVNQELTEKHEAYVRSVAELQNLRKRNAVELEKARKFAIDRFARSLLEVMESLDKACEMDDSDDFKAVQEGVELTRKQLMNVFEKESIHQILPNPGDPFDVNAHEAMTSVPTADMPPNHIVEVFRPGYMIHDRLLRAAMVIVSAELPQNTGLTQSDDGVEELSEDA